MNRRGSDSPPRVVPQAASQTATASRDRRRWRETLRQRRRAISAAEAQRAARTIAEQLCASELWRHEHIALYVASDGEIDPAGIAREAHSQGKALYLPVLETGTQMHFAHWRPGDELRPNRYGIGEPARRGAREERAGGVTSPALLLLPLVGWTRTGFRLGMGGGYYDRYLASRAAEGAFCLGLAYECQQESALDALREAWDVPLNGVLTERRLLRFD